MKSFLGSRLSQLSQLSLSLSCWNSHWKLEIENGAKWHNGKLVLICTCLPPTGWCSSGWFPFFLDFPIYFFRSSVSLCWLRFIYVVLFFRSFHIDAYVQLDNFFFMTHSGLKSAHLCTLRLPTWCLCFCFPFICSFFLFYWCFRCTDDVIMWKNGREKENVMKIK